jgi:hypothetical protein
MRMKVLACGVVLEPDQVTALDWLSRFARLGFHDALSLLYRPDCVIVAKGRGSSYNLLPASSAIVDPRGSQTAC